MLRVSPLMGFEKKNLEKTRFEYKHFNLVPWQMSLFSSSFFIMQTLYSSVFLVWQQELTHKCPRPLGVTPSVFSAEDLGKRRVSLTTYVLYTRFQLYRFIRPKSPDVCAYKMCPLTFIYTKRITKNDSQYQTQPPQCYEFSSIPSI